LSGLLAAVFFAALGNLVLLERTRRPGLCAHLALGLLTTVQTVSLVATGGFYDPNFAWLYVVPVAAAVVVPLRGTLAWLGVTLALTVVFWSLPELGIHLVNHVPPESRAGQALVDRVTAILALAAIAGGFVVAQRRAERELEAANATLVRETDHVSLLRHAAVAANRANSLDDALHAGVSGICLTMGWPLGHAFRLDDDGALVSSGIYHVEDPDHLETLREATSKMRVRGEERLVGRALSRRTPQSVHDIGRFPGPRTQLGRALGIETHVAVPVLAQGEVCAVLEFGLRTRIERENRLLEVLADVGLQLGRVAERTGLEDQVRQAQKMDAIGQLAAGVAHEVNNPMTYVRANLEALRGEWDSLRDGLAKADGDALVDERLVEAEELIDESLEGVNRTIAIVRDVNEFSRTGGPLLESVEIDEIIESAVRVASTHSATGVAIGRSAEATPTVRGSSTQLHQVFVNLIANAIHATGGTGRVRIESERAGREVLVRVSDDGPGVEPEHASRIFEPFFTTKPVGEGTGLGLYISYQIVRSHGGEIRLDSTPGDGATFEVRLPLSSS
ncbi:MAG: ATP-binding protein, partial [Myxococcales bacterium]|nr:ATP-binding protein [Myxococcales bacterium]